MQRGFETYDIKKELSLSRYVCHFVKVILGVG